MQCWGFNEFEPTSCTNNVCLKSNRILKVKKSCFPSAFIIPHILFSISHYKALHLFSSFFLLFGENWVSFWQMGPLTMLIFLTRWKWVGHHDNYLIFFCQQSHYCDSNTGALNEGLSTPAVMKRTKPLNVRDLPRPCWENEPLGRCSLFSHLPRLREVHTDIKMQPL